MYLKHQDLSKYWVLDIEANSLTPTIIWVIVCRNIATDEVKEFFNAEDFAAFHKEDYIYVTHNGLTYDIPAIQKLWKVSIRLSAVVDTMVLSYLYWPNIPDGHSLGSWGERLRVYKSDFHDFSKLTEEMVTYCVQDTKVTKELFLRLTERMTKKGWSEQSAYIEHRFRVIINQQENNGFQFDVERAKALYQELRDKEAELGEIILRKFEPKRKSAGRHLYKLKKDGTPHVHCLKHFQEFEIDWITKGVEYEKFTYEPFNIASPPQRVERLLSLGWVPVKFTKKTANGGGGNPKVDEDSLLEFYEESGIEEVALIAEWLVYNGRANMVNTWLNAVQDDGCIHGSVFSCGAQSRRCTHSSPNTANIPSVEAKYGVECRSLWTAREGRVLVGTDAKSLEALLFAHTLGGQQEHIDYMMGDTHQMNKEAVDNGLGIETKRSQNKTGFYAYIFGAYPPKIGGVFGLDAKAGEKIIQILENAVPGLGDAMAAAQAEWRKNGGLLKCLDGGYVRCPSERSALNYKIQPAGSVFMKQAAILFDNSVNKESLDVLKVGDIHDEWQNDTHVDHAHRVGELSVQAMEESGKLLNLLVPMSGEYKIGRNWAETH